MPGVESQSRVRGQQGGDPGLAPRTRETLSTAGQPLDQATRAFMEPRFGHDFSRVRVHMDAQSARTAAEMDARAFTVGRDIVFGAGEYVPATPDGRRLIAHELAHTIQQQSSAPPSPQTKLRLSEPGDASEVLADRAADAVVSGERTPALAPVPGNVLQRQRERTCSRGAPGENTTVRCTDDTEYDVRVIITPGRRVPATRTDVNAGLAALTTLFLRVDVCRGQHDVRITASMNVADPLRRVIENALSGSPLLGGVRIEPRVGARWTFDRNLQIEAFGGPTIVPGAPRTGWEGGVRGQVGPVTIEGGVGSDPTLTGPGGGPEVHVTGRVGITPGRVPPVNCTRPATVEYECRRVSHTPPVPGRAADDVQVYVFFEYATANVIPPTPIVQRGSVVDPGATLASLAADGFRATSIDAFTSPEGPLRVPRPRPGRFAGNIPLSEQRGISARDWLRANCPHCIGPTEPVPRGQGELHSGGSQPELTGDRLTRRAREGFLGHIPDEPRDPLARPTDDLRLATLTPAQQRAEIYPKLRRAVISLHRPEVPGQESERRTGAAEACPADVRAAMERQ